MHCVSIKTRPKSLRLMVLRGEEYRIYRWSNACICKRDKEKFAEAATQAVIQASTHVPHTL